MLEVTWTFVLDEIAPGATRLLVRVRGGPRYRFHGLPYGPTSSTRFSIRSAYRL
jgi:hypothetical protein